MLKVPEMDNQQLSLRNKESSTTKESIAWKKNSSEEASTVGVKWFRKAMDLKEDDAI